MCLANKRCWTKPEKFMQTTKKYAALAAIVCKSQHFEKKFHSFCCHFLKRIDYAKYGIGLILLCLRIHLKQLTWFAIWIYDHWACLHTVIDFLNVNRSCFFQFHAAIVNNPHRLDRLARDDGHNDESEDNACQVDLNHDISIELLFYCLFDILSWAINGILTDTKRNLKQNRIQMTRKFSQTVHLSCLVVFCQFSTENVYEVEEEIMWFCIIWLYFWLPNVSFHDT